MIYVDDASDTPEALESFKNLDIRGLEDTDVAVTRLVKTIDGLTMADTGRFLQPDGKDQAW